MIHAGNGLGCNNSALPLFQYSVISKSTHSLNAKQQQLFEVAHKWSRDYMKNLSSKTMKRFHIFLTAGAGVGKPHLVKTVYISIGNVLM